MNTQTKPPDVPFNALAAYERGRDENRRLYDLLNRSLMLLDMECDRRELRGENVKHIRAFIKEARA